MGCGSNYPAAIPQPCGREVRLDGRPFTVVGVMPHNFVFIDPEVQLWIPAQIATPVPLATLQMGAI
jgi:hypothetical protein